jgi:exodeoxyribonuclease VII small subunit
MPKSFEQQIQRLEEIVDLLDRGDVAIEQMLKLYQEGMSLSKQCRIYLETAEQKVTSISAQASLPDSDSLKSASSNPVSSNSSKLDFEQTEIDVEF